MKLTIKQIVVWIFRLLKGRRASLYISEENLKWSSFEIEYSYLITPDIVLFLGLCLPSKYLEEAKEIIKEVENE